MKRAVVTGATGFVGGAVVDKLLADGWDVTALVRDPGRLHARHRGRVTPLVGDLSRDLPAFPAVDAVVHAAADMDFGRSTARMADVTVGGTERVLRALPDGARLVHVSSQAVYGFDRHYDGADESTPMRESPYAYCETKRRAEDLVWASGRPVTVVRPGFVYGPGDERTLPPIAAQLQARTLNAHVAGGAFDTGCVHVANCAAAIVAAATVPAALGEAFHVGDGRVLTIKAMIDGFARGLDVPAPHGSIPRGVAMALGYAVEGAWTLFRRPGPPPLSPFLVAMLTRNSGFSIDKAARVLGYTPVRQWEESLGETIAWCHEVNAR